MSDLLCELNSVLDRRRQPGEATITAGTIHVLLSGYLGVTGDASILDEARRRFRAPGEGIDVPRLAERLHDKWLQQQMGRGAFVLELAIG